MHRATPGGARAWDAGNPARSDGVERTFARRPQRLAVPMPSISQARAAFPRLAVTVCCSLLLAVGSVAAAQPATPFDTTAIREVDRLRLLEARRIAHELGDLLWP